MPEKPERDPNCWVLTYPDGPSAGLDNEVHFSSEANAAKDVKRYTNTEFGKPAPRRLPAVCVTIDCFCCGTTFDEEGEGVEHHESIESAREAAAGCCWSIAADGTPKCEECKAGECDCAADLPAPSTVTEVHPDQVPLLPLPLGEEA